MVLVLINLMICAIRLFNYLFYKKPMKIELQKIIQIHITLIPINVRPVFFLNLKIEIKIHFKISAFFLVNFFQYGIFILISSLK